MKPGDIISYLEMCTEEGFHLQKGMNFKLKDNYSVILMSVRKGAPYNDEVLKNGKLLIYEGHDINKKKNVDPKKEDQPMYTKSGNLTQNGLFYYAAKSYQEENSEASVVKVYEKVKPGIWVFTGFFNLINSYIVKEKERKVFKFELSLMDNEDFETSVDHNQYKEHNRVIPTQVKLEVWKRDKGKCRKCGSNKNLHFDHIIPFSKGGTSLSSENIQILCENCNLKKHAKIE